MDRLKLSMTYTNIPSDTELQLTSTLFPVSHYFSELDGGVHPNEGEEILETVQERKLQGGIAQNSTSYYRQFSRSGVVMASVSEV